MAAPGENFKEVVVNDRKFIVKKFDARTGAYMAFKVAGIIAPILKGLDLGRVKQPQNPEDIASIDFATIGSSLLSLKEEDFNFVYDKCLQVCFENLGAGPTQVMNSEGNFGVMGMENDSAAALALVVHALMFNVMGFFQGNPLASALGGLITKSSIAKM